MSYTNSIGGDLQLSLVNQTSSALKTTADAGAVGSTGKTTSPNTSVTESDQTTLSSASTLLAQALSVSDVRTDKVAALQQSIAAGTYQVSSSDVADKLLQSLLG